MSDMSGSSDTEQQLIADDERHRLFWKIDAELQDMTPKMKELLGVEVNYQARAFIAGWLVDALSPEQSDGLDAPVSDAGTMGS